MKLLKIVLTPPILAISAILAIALQAESKTIALWPLECDSRGQLDGRCLIDPVNNLTLHSSSGLSFEPTALGWQIPPNPDPAGHWVDILNQSSVKHTGTSGAFAEASSRALFDTMKSIGDFTVEGWVKFDAKPARGGWYPFFQSVAGGVNNMFSFRHSRKEAGFVTEDNPDGYYYDIECYNRGCNADGNPGGDYIAYKMSEAEVDAFIADWHHIALTLDHTDPNKTMLRFYIDGELVYSAQASKFWKTDDENVVVYMGGRATDSLSASLDYWRISDVALEPEDFLYAKQGGKTVVAAPTTTYAYWKLDSDENGIIDLRNSVGDYAHLRKNSFVSPSGNAGDSQWSEPNAFEPDVDMAFEGNPPNCDLVFNNLGCVSLQHPGMGLKAYGLGEKLMPTGSFTVEGWFNPVQEEGAARYDTNDFGRVFAIADPDTVWSLRLKKKADGTRVFAVEAADDTTKDGGAALASGEFAASIPRKDEWHHLALAYDAASGNGTWSFYLDGTAAGSVANVRAPLYAGTIVATNGFLGSTTVPGGDRTKSKTGYAITVPGRAANDWVFGRYDFWRASQGALQPSQFLCTAGGTPPAVTLCIWPLDYIEKNACRWIMGRDAKNACHFTGTFYNDANYGNVSITAEGATVTNPDRSANFRGNPAVNGGAAQIKNNNNVRGFFVCDDPGALALFGDGTRDMTFEFYSRRLTAMNDWEIVVSGDTANLGYGTDGLNFSSRAAGFKLWMAAASLTSDYLFADSLNRVNDTTTWHHFALVKKYNASDKKCYISLYEDGQLCSTLSGTAKLHKIVNMVFFGRPSGGGYYAIVDEIRLSSAALSPSQFLNAAPEPAVTPRDDSRKTMGYWKLENDGGAAVLGNAIVPSCALSGEATGSDDVGAALGKIRNPDTTLPFEGDPARDYGSAVLNGALENGLAGARLELTSPFTVEGWIKPVLPTSAGYDICGASNAEGTGSWRLRAVRDGDAVRLRLFAQSPFAWTLIPVDAAFDADLAGRIGTWTHLAVAYDPSVGKGTWTLYVDGLETDSIENACTFRDEAWGLSTFTLGSSAGCGFDEWRLSRSALTSEDLIYRDAPGFLLMLR